MHTLCFLICSLVRRHGACFHPLDIVNNAALDTDCWYPLEALLFILFRLCVSGWRKKFLGASASGKSGLTGTPWASQAAGAQRRDPPHPHEPAVSVLQKMLGKREICCCCRYF